MATSTMAVRDTLQTILKLEELQKDTAITTNIVACIHRLLTLDQENNGHLERLVAAMQDAFNRMLQSVQQYRLVSTRREKLWVLFHRFSLEDGIEICKSCDVALNLSAPETFWQLMLEKEFLKVVTASEQAQASSSSLQRLTSKSTSARQLSIVEENAVRYTAGYIIRKLEKKYSQKMTQENIECLRALREMAGKLSTRNTSSYSESSKWSRLTDRGGLYHVEDVVFELFITLELITDEELTAIFTAKGKGIEKVKKEKLSWICDDEDVQFLWCMVSSTTIESDEVRQCLLKEIAYLWITTRGHSKAQKIKEDHKKAKGKGVKGKHSLRKELASSVVITDHN